MVRARREPRRPGTALRGWLALGRRLPVFFAFWLLLGAGSTLQAVPQFDVFLGYDGIVPEASWFPLVCEIKNDGPGFMGIVEVSLSGNYGSGQVRRVPVELPTGTLKRLTIPVFPNSRGYSSWDVRLLDERGRVRAEPLTPPNVRKRISASVPLMGSVARTAAGIPTLRQLNSANSDEQPLVARMQPSIFPDNPLLLDGLSSIYLNSTAAIELKNNQYEALLGWLHAGGHLIIGVEQTSDINSTRWLKNLCPCELKDMRTIERHDVLREWLSSPAGLQGPGLRTAALAAMASRGRPGLRTDNVGAGFNDLAEDQAFDTATNLLVATGTVLEGHVVVGTDEGPLIVTTTRGQGRVTVLLFSPEREPMRSWKNLSTFWTKLAEVPADWYSNPQQQRGYMGGMSSDGIFGAMLDTRQVHKLPVLWLLLLLIVYLVVIGPLDQYWLKKIRRPMLTWVTFPCYVVMFSLLIYFIGYKLRAGESEWNELHVVDVLRQGDQAQLRGHTYASVYSPANQRYTLESQQKYSTLRGEFAGNYGGGASTEKTSVLQKGDSFKADVFVAVWTSQLLVNDWWQSAETPLEVSVNAAGTGWNVKVANHTDRKLANAQIAIEDRIYGLGDIAPNQAKTFEITKSQGRSIMEFLSGYSSQFQSAVSGRRQAFGAAESGHINDLPNASVAASFLSAMGPVREAYNGRFISPPGLDVTPVVERGNALLFAWAGDYSPIKQINQFTTRRFHQDTLWRAAAAVK